MRVRGATGTFVPTQPNWNQIGETALAPRLLLNFIDSYSFHVTNPHLVEAADDDLAVVWGYSPRSSTVRVRADVLFQQLMELDTTDPESVRRFTRRYGPFFPHVPDVDPADVAEAWLDFVETAPAAKRRRLRNLSADVVAFASERGVRESLTAIDGEWARLRGIAADVGVLALRDGEYRSHEPLEDRAMNGGRGISGAFGVRYERLDGLSRAPTLWAAPRATAGAGCGVFAVAELGLMRLLIEKSQVRQCLSPLCGRLFMRQSRHHRQYCPAPRDCKAEWQKQQANDRAQDRRLARQASAIH